MISYEFTAGSSHLLRIPRGDGIVETLTEFARSHEIRAAWLSYLGAVTTAELRYYDQDAREYRDFTIDEHLEVLSGVGNISVLDGEPFVHTHAVFGDAEGRAWGGHLNEGTRAFLIEARLEVLQGDAPLRELDESIGLSVWCGNSAQSGT